MKFYSEEQEYLLIKNLSRGRTKYWPSVEARFIFYEDTTSVKVEYVYLSSRRRLYRITPSQNKPYLVTFGFFGGTNTIEQMTGLKKQLAIKSFERLK